MHDHVHIELDESNPRAADIRKALDLGLIAGRASVEAATKVREANPNWDNFEIDAFCNAFAASLAGSMLSEFGIGTTLEVVKRVQGVVLQITKSAMSGPPGADVAVVCTPDGAVEPLDISKPN